MSTWIPTTKQEIPFLLQWGGRRRPAVRNELDCETNHWSSAKNNPKVGLSAIAVR